MPASPYNSSNSALDRFGEDPGFMLGEIWEQPNLPNLFHDAGMDYPSPHGEFNNSTAQWYSSLDLHEAKTLLILLRDANVPLTKIQIAQLRYPQIFQMADFGYLDPEGKTWNFRKLIQREYVNKVGKLLRCVSDCVNRQLDLIENNNASKLDYLHSVSLAIQVGEDHKRRSLFVYHGPDYQQPPEVLESFLAWAEAHQERNGRMLRLATELTSVIFNPLGMQLNNEDLPDVDDPWLDNFASNG